MIQEIQLDGQQDLDARKAGLAAIIERFAAELEPNDQVAVCLILSPDTDLRFPLSGGVSANDALIAIDANVKEYKDGLAAVRPQPVAVPADLDAALLEAAVKDFSLPSDAEVQAAEEEAPAVEGEAASDEAAQVKKGRKKQ